ncbi:XRE family transcriptional regulator [Lysinibacillus sp. 2017]|uniref:helix-turn-helix domain-containing protein n=1 Tax=unclassified Lysinibacillus TaxID=2636778 RepID=UPI000D525E6D|nr:MULTISPECIES: XRE family transcriptional regulator [unclassified Lysinibacillus]AWE06923.1 XRE family transcriptional regulator [Lysinibacillus sp. 2017]TGN37150.1 XRE family transcriptional regulator [Lysinibacillus sp. S2017]
MNLVEVGSKIKQMRKKSKMSQLELADLIGLTKSHISKIENAKATPSLATLSKIAGIFHVPMAWFVIQEEFDGISIVSKKQRAETVETNELGYQYELLANKSYMSNINPSIVTVHNGAENLTPYLHDNDEFIYVITGSILLKYDNKLYTLDKGDSAYFSGKKEHIFINNSPENSKVLTIYVDE